MSLLGEIERHSAAQQVGTRGVLRFITAGSVDDGKSTLIGRLLHDTRSILEDQLSAVARASTRRGLEAIDLSLLTDGLEAEREQGITIDVAYRYFATAQRKFIIADTPGHEQYTRNMVTGASTADAAVILIDVRKGLLAQSKRHLYIAHLLGIRHVIVAVNKMDLASFRREAFETVRSAFERFAAPLAFDSLQLIPVSALGGDMVAGRGGNLWWYQGSTLLEALEAIDMEDQALAQPFRFPVQLVSRSAGRRSYLGRVASGTIRVGGEVVALPSGRRSRVREIHPIDGTRAFARAGDSVALTLADELDISRGDMLADAASPPRVAKALEARLCWFGTEPLATSGRYLLKHTTRTVKARLVSVNDRIDVDNLEHKAFEGQVRANDIVHVTLLAQQPVVVDPYARNAATGAFILIDELSNQTVAAGMLE